MERNLVLGVAVLVLALLAGGYIYNVVTTDTFAATNPQANLDFERHPANESVSVIHRKGESYDRQNTKALEVYVFPVDKSRPSAPRTTVDLPFAEGDTATISNVTDNDRVVVLWRGESNSHVLGNYSVRSGENGLIRPGVRSIQRNELTNRNLFYLRSVSNRLLNLEPEFSTRDWCAMRSDSVSFPGPT